MLLAQTEEGRHSVLSRSMALRVTRSSRDQFATGSFNKFLDRLVAIGLEARKPRAARICGPVITGLPVRS